MDSLNERDNFAPSQSIYEETYIKDYAEAEAEEYLKVQELSFNCT